MIGEATCGVATFGSNEPVTLAEQPKPAFCTAKKLLAVPEEIKIIVETPERLCLSVGSITLDVSHASLPAALRVLIAHHPEFESAFKGSTQPSIRKAVARLSAPENA